MTALFRYERAPDGGWGNDRQYPRFLLKSESKDGGRTWSRMVATNVDGFPPHVLRLKDGRLLLSYASRTLGRRGIYAVVSSNDGRTWDTDHEIRLYESETDDLGYPSTAENADGSLVTVYYGFPNRNRPATILATKWRLP